MVQPIEVWFEFASTYSYPAVIRAEEMARASGVPVKWRPFLLGPIFAELGMNDSPFNIYPAKGAYMWRDLERICSALDLPFKKPTKFPRGSLIGARIASIADGKNWQGEFIRRVYKANFADDVDIGSPTEVSKILSSLGVDGSHWIEKASRDKNKAVLKSNTQEASDLQLFGAPTFMVGKEMFWGNDRLEQALDWASS